MVTFLDPEQLRSLVVERFTSKEWWVLAAGKNCDALMFIEERFYSGEANADFHMFVTPRCPTFGFALALKKRMSTEAFNAFAEELELSTRVAADEDVLIFHPGGQGAEECILFLAWFSALLGGREAL